MTNIPSIFRCNHFFMTNNNNTTAPQIPSFCDKRIALFAIGLIALVGIAFSIIRKNWSRSVSLEKKKEISCTTQNQTKEIQLYSDSGKKAIEFAKEQMKSNPTESFIFSAGWFSKENTHQPINKEIAILTNLYRTVAWPKLKRLLEENQVDPWGNKEVIEAADTCMKIAFAISNLTLDDLNSFTENLKKEKSVERSYEEALTLQDSYMYRTFYYCPWTYNFWRGECNISNQESIKDRVELFYQEGTKQNEWRTLYNEYCQRVRLYVNEENLRKKDKRHDNWTQEDVNKETGFRLFPDTMLT
jgi:hypothetical protein